MFKLLFGDKSILQSQADGHLVRCNRSLSLVSLWRAPLTDVELYQTCWLTSTVCRTKQGSERWSAKKFSFLSSNYSAGGHDLMHVNNNKKKRKTRRLNKVEYKRDHVYTWNKGCQELLKGLTLPVLQGFIVSYITAPASRTTTAGGTDVIKEFK